MSPGREGWLGRGLNSCHRRGDDGREAPLGRLSDPSEHTPCHPFLQQGIRLRGAWGLILDTSRNLGGVMNTGLKACGREPAPGDWCPDSPFLQDTPLMLSLWHRFQDGVGQLSPDPQSVQQLEDYVLDLLSN